MAIAILNRGISIGHQTRSKSDPNEITNEPARQKTASPLLDPRSGLSPSAIDGLFAKRLYFIY